jgi:electron transfer flavoprotein alpha subunit
MNKHVPGSGIPRIDPRRPFTITSAGLIRITLGATHVSHRPDSVDTHSLMGRHAVKAKPRRIVGDVAHCILVAAYADRGALDDHARQTVAAAALLADARTEVVLIVFGPCHDDLAALGADKGIVVDAVNRLVFAPETALHALESAVAKYRPLHLLMPDKPDGDGDLGRRFAAISGKSVATRVVEIAPDHVAVYGNGGRQFATRSVPEVVLLNANAVDPALPFVGAGERVDAETVVPKMSDAGAPIGTGPCRYRDLGIEATDAARLPLEEADAIVAAGNGLHDVPALERLAVTLGAAIGASRVAVDDGRFTRDKQIGATGKTVEASLYIAFGISGAVQHLQGIKSCRHVIAVNTDASAPISSRANLTIVDDAAAIVAGLTDVIGAARRARHDAALVETRSALPLASPIGPAVRPPHTTVATPFPIDAGAVA